MEIPLFPLHAVLCPGVALPLHIFEPRYRLMIRRCLAEDRPFGVVWIRDGRDVGVADLAVAAVGTLAEIREADRYADGRYDIVTVGTGRFRIRTVDTVSEPYLTATVEPLDEVIGDQERATSLVRLVTRRFVRYVDAVRELLDEADPAGAAPSARRQGLVERSEPDALGSDADRRPGEVADRSGLAMPADPLLLSHLLAGIVEVDPVHRQALLEAPTAVARLEALADLLARETIYLDNGLRVVRPDPVVGTGARN
ncbi:MAG TPA: LON peptidase substrate-binding domain-containing protein [Candidatus Limnocylindrales bacterium]|nr:LON peptidase substrate-binding domain-containing protein [Candidatus Limnocylindrales bacterium]